MEELKFPEDLAFEILVTETPTIELGKGDTLPLYLNVNDAVILYIMEHGEEALVSGDPVTPKDVVSALQKGSKPLVKMSFPKNGTGKMSIEVIKGWLSTVEKLLDDHDN